MKRIAVVVVNWNSWKDTKECLASLEDIHSSRKHEIFIIVVDNASSDDSVSRIRERFANISLLVNSTNEGYSGGYNRGIRFALESKSDFVFVVNNDTFFAPDCVTELVESLESDSKVGAVGPKIYFARNFEFHKSRYKAEEKGKVLWCAGGKIDWKNVLVSHRGVDEIDHGQFDKHGETDFISGCAMMFPRRVLERVGLFDKRYYLYYEDVDLSLRIKKKGYRLRFVSQAKLWHKNATSSFSGSNLQDYYMTRNRLLFGLTYAPIKSKIALILESIRLLHSGRIWQRRGIIDAVLNRWGKGSYG